MIYTFEDFEFDTRRQLVKQRGSEIKMEPQVFDLLHLLIENNDRLVTKDEIIDTIWNGRAISDTAVASRISSARRVLNDDGRQQRLIKTVHNRGLRFLGNPKKLTSAQLSPPDMRRSKADDTKPYVIVMPFKARPDNEMELFTADALVDEISALLTSMETVNIIPRYAAGFTLAIDTDPLSLARELGAQYAVTGYVRREGQRLRVRAKLAELGEYSQLWSKKFDSSMDNIFTIEDDVTAGVIGALGGKIAHVEAVRLLRQTPENLKAWELARMALAAALDWRPETLAQSVHSCRQALDLDSNYALAHAYLGFYLAWQVAQGWSEDPRTERAESEHYAEQAFKLTQNDGEVLSAIGDTYRCLGQLEKAVAFYDTARARNRDVFNMWPVSLPIMGTAYAQFGQDDKARAVVQEYEDKFPGDDMGGIWLDVTTGYIELCARNYQRAEVLLANSLSEYNDMCRIIALVKLARMDEAKTEYRRLSQNRPSLSLDHYIEHFKSYHIDEAVSDELSAALSELKLNLN